MRDDSAGYGKNRFLAWRCEQYASIGARNDNSWDGS
jgi:hypothetical protein